MIQVLVVGSANYDFTFNCGQLPKEGETVLGTTLKVSPGGKGANQAVAVGKLKGSVSFCGCVGDDPYGESLRESLAEAGVQIEFLRTTEVQTGTAAVLVGASGSNQIVVCPGANALVTAQQVEEAIRRTSPQVVLTQLEIPMEAVWAASFSDRFILNPAPATRLEDGLLSRCFAITPNESEAEALTGIRPHDGQSCRDAARALLERGVANVVITLGERGCFWSSPAGEQFLEAPKVATIDTTAAGDAFSGALALKLSEGTAFPEAIGFATRVAALSTTKRGAQASMPTLEEEKLCSETNQMSTL